MFEAKPRYTNLQRDIISIIQFESNNFGVQGKAEGY